MSYFEIYVYGFQHLIRQTEGQWNYHVTNGINTGNIPHYNKQLFVGNLLQNNYQVLFNKFDNPKATLLIWHFCPCLETFLGSIKVLLIYYHLTTSCNSYFILLWIMTFHKINTFTELWCLVHINTSKNCRKALLLTRYDRWPTKLSRSWQLRILSMITVSSNRPGNKEHSKWMRRHTLALHNFMESGKNQYLCPWAHNAVQGRNIL